MVKFVRVCVLVRKGMVKEKLVDYMPVFCVGVRVDVYAGDTVTNTLACATPVLVSSHRLTAIPVSTFDRKYVTLPFSKYFLCW